MIHQLLLEIKKKHLLKLYFNFNKDKNYKGFKLSTNLKDDYYCETYKVYFDKDSINNLTESGCNLSLKILIIVQNKKACPHFIILKLNKECVCSTTYFKDNNYVKKINQIIY
ncbi:MAG: hypothetical protein LBR40_06450 [Bacilli bacterium]|jgi:hypothetical protein|nr:hypothetical protein [Bacilli bacterium]